MEKDVSVESLKEWYSIANQDRQERIANFIGQPEGGSPPCESLREIQWLS
jgi:hypothetical protein